MEGRHPLYILMGGKGSGGKPKVYPADMVEDVRRLYIDDGRSQVEVAAAMGTTQKVIWNLMRRHGLETRPQIKRDQRGPKNDSWKGSAAGYAALHLRVYTERGCPRKCEVCGTTDRRKRYEWANLTGQYDDPQDYKRMCTSCHHRHDGTIRNITNMREKLEVAREE